MNKDLTPEQEQIMAEYYEAHTWSAKKRIKAMCILALICGVVLSFFFGLGLSSSFFQEEADLLKLLTMVSAILTLFLLGVFGLIAMRSDKTFLAWVGPLRITENVLIIINALCFLSVFRTGAPLFWVPLVGVVFAGGLLILTLKEKKRLKEQEA